MPPTSANFTFLKPHGQQLYRLAVLSEGYFRAAPNTTLMKLRQFAELLAQEVAARSGVLSAPEASFSDVLSQLKRSRRTPRQILDFFHLLRVKGNDAVHGDLDDFGAALTGLKVARELAFWYVRSYGGQPDLKPAPFLPPPAPEDPTAALKQELERLRAEADAHRSAAEIAQARAEARAGENLETGQRLRREAEEKQVWRQLAEEVEASSAEVRAKLESLQQRAAEQPAVEVRALEEAVDVAANLINLDKAATRELIDQQLHDAEWEVDTKTLRHARGRAADQGAQPGYRRMAHRQRLGRPMCP
jgi:type I restriction enzyme R subunit